MSGLILSGLKRSSLIASGLKQGAQLPSARWVWTANGTSFGDFTQADLDSGSSRSSMYVFSSLPVSTINVFESDDNINYVSINSGGVVSITGNLTATLNGVSVVSGVTTITIDDNLIFDVLPTAIMSVSKTPSITLLPTCKLYYLKITGITNLDAYPSGTATWLMDTYAPDNGYIFPESDNSFPELWVHGDISASAQAGGGVGNSQAAVIAGSNYLFTFTLDITEGAVKVYNGGVTSYTESGTYSEIVTALESTIQFLVVSNPTTCTISNISVKQTTAMQLYNALPQDFTEEVI